MKSRSELLLAGIALVLCMAYLWDYFIVAIGMDYYHFWLVPRVISTHNDIYSKQGREVIKETSVKEIALNSPHERFVKLSDYHKRLYPTGSPFFYMCFAPFAWENYEWSYLFFQLVSFASCFGAIILLGYMLGYSNLMIMISFFVFFTWFEPMKSDIRVSNVNRLLFALIILYLWLKQTIAVKRRGFDYLCGIILSVLMVFKPITAFIPLLLFASRYIQHRIGEVLREGIGFVSFSLIAIISSTFYFSRTTCWIEWFRQLDEVNYITMPMKNGNLAFRAFLVENITINPIIVSLLISGIILLVFFYALLKKRIFFPYKPFDPLSNRSFQVILDILVLTVALLVYLLTTTLFWIHYYVLLIPVFMVLLRPHSRLDSFRYHLLQKICTIIAFLLVAMYPLQSFLRTNDVAIIVPSVFIGLGFLLTALYLELFSLLKPISTNPAE